MKNRSYCLLALVLVVALAETSLALVTPCINVRTNYLHNTCTARNQLGRWSSAPLLMQDTDDEAEAIPGNDGKAEVEEVSSPEEDPEVTALKDEISKLESELKSRRASLSQVLDQVEEYSKAGYARAVAEMENMRRVRSVSFSKYMEVLSCHRARWLTIRFHNNAEYELIK